MNLMFKTIFGSHLYGTDTPTSDRDYKGAFVANVADIILKQDKENIHTSTKSDDRQKNNSEDVDTELIELRKFLSDAMAGQTYALDMLFAPEFMWLESSDRWRFIVQNRDKLLSKNVEPYIGYCRQQAGKYGLKGSRLGTIIAILKHLENANPELPISYAVELGFFNELFGEYFSVVEKTHQIKGGQPHTQKFLKVLEKHYDVSMKLRDLRDALIEFEGKYGERARLAANNEGIDWKAISHAYRCMLQLKELANTGEIKFPLHNADYLRDIKKGKIPYSFINIELPKLMGWSIKAVNESKYLKDEPDREFWKQFIVDSYI